MIRAMDRFYEKHPRIAFCIALVALCVIGASALAWDKSDTAAIRMQMMARGA